jgi:hypothetical protein
MLVRLSGCACRGKKSRSDGCHQAHPLALANSGPLSVTSLQGAAVDMAVGASVLWQDEYQPFGPDSQPGNHVVELFQSRFYRHGPVSKKDEDIVKYRDQLDLAWVEAYIDELCCMVAADASVPTGGVFQAAAAALVHQQGEVVSYESLTKLRLILQTQDAVKNSV